MDDLFSVDSKGLSDKTCKGVVRINKQDPDIAEGAYVGKERWPVTRASCLATRPTRLETKAPHTLHSNALEDSNF